MFVGVFCCLCMGKTWDKLRPSLEESLKKQDCSIDLNPLSDFKMDFYVSVEHVPTWDSTVHHMFFQQSDYNIFWHEANSEQQLFF